MFLGQVQIGPWVFNLSKLTLLAEFAVMAVVLVARPWGLMGKPPAPASHAAKPERPIAPPASAWLAYGALLALLIARRCWASNGRTWPSC